MEIYNISAHHDFLKKNLAISSLSRLKTSIVDIFKYFLAVKISNPKLLYTRIYLAADCNLQTVSQQLKKQATDDNSSYDNFYVPIVDFSTDRNIHLCELSKACGRNKFGWGYPISLKNRGENSNANST